MAADALAPFVAKTSAIVFTVQVKEAIVFNEEGFQLLVPPLRWEMKN